MKLTKNSSFKDFADFWLEHYMLGFVKNNTYMGTYYHQTYYNLIPYFGNFKISDIKHLKYDDEEGELEIFLTDDTQITLHAGFFESFERYEEFFALLKK